MAADTAVGVISFDLEVRNKIEEQITAIAETASKMLRGHFDPGKILSDSMSGVEKRIEKTVSGAFEEAAKSSKKAMEEVADSITYEDSWSKKQGRGPVDDSPEARRVPMSGVGDGTVSGLASLREAVAAVDKSVQDTVNNAVDMSDMFRAATDPAELLQQKAANLKLQMQEAQAKLARLVAEQQKLNDSDMGTESAQKLNGQITQAESKLISLQQQIQTTEAKISKLSTAAAQSGTNFAGAYKTIKQSFEGVKSKASRVFGKIGSTAKGTAEKVKHEFTKNTRSVGGAFTKLGKTVKSSFKAVFLTAGLYAVFRGIKSLISATTTQNEKFSKSLNEVKANLKAAFMPIMQAVMPALQSLMDGLAAATKHIAEFVAAIFGTTYSASLKAAEGIDKAANKAKKSMSGLDEIHTIGDQRDGGIDYGAIAADSGKVSGALDGLIQKISSVGAKIKEKFAPSITAWGMAFEKLVDPVKSTAERIRDSIGGLWNESLGPFAGYVIDEFIPNIANEFSNTFAPIFSDVVGTAIEEAGKDFDWFCKNVKQDVKKVFKPATETMEKVTTDALGTVKEQWSETGTSLLEKFISFKDSLREHLSWLWGLIRDFFGYLISKFSELWDKHLKPLWDKLVGFITSVAECLLTIWNNVLSPLIDFVKTVLEPIIRTVGKSIIDIVTDIFGIIADVVGGVLQALSGLLDFITGVFTGNWKKAWNGIKDFFAGIWNGIWGIVKGAINLIIDGLNLLWGAMYSVVSGVVNGIGSIAGAIGDLFGQDWHFTMPSKPPLIPKLAQGGIISQPTLAMVGERGKEAVVPLEHNTGWLDQIAAMLAERIGNSGGDTTITIPINLDGRKISEIVVDHINRKTTMTGRSPLMGVS